MDTGGNWKRVLNTGNGPRIVVIGGGTGLSVILRGIKQITDNVSAIVTVCDDGGGSGKLRCEMGTLPPGDVRRCILAMADQEGVMEQLLQYRFNSGTLAGQNMGNLMIAALSDLYGNFEVAIEKIHEILRLRGHVIPVTVQDVVLCALLENGELVMGESKIPQEVIRQNSCIKRVYLEPSLPEPVPAAVEAILQAEMIIFGPGSLYTSIIPNLLVKDITKALQESQAIKMLICNLMTQHGETDGYSVTDYTRTILDYLGEPIVEYILLNNRVCSPEDMAPYLEQGNQQMCITEVDRKNLNDMGITIIENNFIEIKGDLIRHDAQRVANVINALLHRGWI